jgi:cytolysin-activating lysine-acyltransferase
MGGVLRESEESVAASETVVASAQAGAGQQALKAHQPSLADFTAKEAILSPSPKPISAAFGDIVALLGRSPLHRHISIADLDWLVVPAILNNQFFVAEATLPDGNTVGVAFVTWARVSEDVDTRLMQHPHYPIRLHPSEWTGGDRLWIIDALGELNALQYLLTKVKNEVFGGKDFKIPQPAIRHSSAQETADAQEVTT